MLIIGITGTLGAGKGTIVDYLIDEKGFRHFSARTFVTKEIIKRGMPVNRDSMVVVANDLRLQNSPSYIIDSLFDEARATGTDSVIESIRTPGEIISLREKGRFFLLAVDAPAEERYRRIQKRASETDHISFATFIENEEREMASTDPFRQNVGRCIEMADFVVQNSGSIEFLHQQIESILDQINNN